MTRSKRAPDGPDRPGERRRARQRPRGARRAQGRRRRGRAPDPAGVADGRLPGCQQADSRGAGCVTVPSGLAGQPGGSWPFPAGNHNGGPLLGRRAGAGHPGPGGGIEMVWFWLGPGTGSRSRRSSRTRIADRSGPMVTTSSPPDRSRPLRLAAASPGWRHRPWRACRASGQRNGRGLRRWPRPSGMRAAPNMPRVRCGRTGRSGPHQAAVRGLPGRVASARSGGGWQPSGHDAIGGMRHRQQCAPSRHRARTRRAETRRPDGACSRSVIGAPPDRSAHSRRSVRCDMPCP